MTIPPLYFSIMPMRSITIVTVNWHSAELIEALLDNLVGKAAHPQNLKAIILDNTNGSDSSLGKIKESISPLTIRKLNPQNLRGDQAHGFALNVAMDMVDTDFTVIVDPDIYVFKNNWDQFCIDEMECQDSMAIGAPFPQWKVGKYHNFPSPPFCFFQTESMKKLDSDWTARSIHKLVNARVFIIRQFGRLGGLITRRRYEQSRFVRKFGFVSEKLFGVFTPDPGWQIARETKRKNIKSVLFDAVMPQDAHYAPDIKNSLFQDLAGEYELFYYKKEPILTHKYNSGGRPWRTAHGDDVEYWHKCITRFEIETNKT